MGKVTLRKRLCSIILAVLMAFTGLLPATTVFAADGVEGYHDIELFYKSSNTIVPTYQEDGETAYIEYMTEGDELELTYKLIDTDMPDNGYIKWYSETPTLVDVTQEGVVKAFDSSKGAVIHAWIDNEVKTVPLVGSIMATAIEKALFNEYVNVDTMDTDAIVAIVEGLFGEGSPLDKWVESYKGELVNSLREYLNNINSNIHVQLFAADGTLLDDDFVNICVLRNDEWYANFLPNGTHITNKSQIKTTVAVGSTAQLYAVTTPVRLNFGVVYSVKSTSVFDTGKVVATVNDSGLVTFKNKGTVTIMVSPDTEQVIQKILELVNYIYKLENTGTINTDKIADILIKYIGIDMNRTVLAAILDVCFAIKDIAGDVADPVQLTATAVEIIGNLVLQFVYNDTITFNVVDAQPLTDFSIEGPNSVQEGTQIQLDIVDIVPDVGDTSDITWSSSDPSIASVDPNTGVVTGRDAGGSLGALSTQKCTIYATSAANNVTKTFEITVKGKTGKYLSDVEIVGKDYLEIGENEDYTYTVYPKRVAEADNLYITWGVQNGTDEEGNPIYVWADSENPATNGVGIIDSKGHYEIVSGGVCTIAVKAVTGYNLSSENFYEISSFIGTLAVTNGIPVEDVQISVTDAAGIVASIKRNEKVIVNGQEYTYVTVNAPTQYFGCGAKISASVYPANATNQNLTWVVDNDKYENSLSDDTHTATIKQKFGHESADTFNVYAVSADGRIKSNVITVCVAKNYAQSNTLEQSSMEMINGTTTDISHNMTFGGIADGTYSACYKCNWYSSDENVFTVSAKNNSNGDATITAVDVGTATLTCVSADGGYKSECQITVYPDKERLRQIVKLCDRTIVKCTPENDALYNEYMRALDLAYYVLYDEPMASQPVCDDYAEDLLFAFYKVGGFIAITDVNILDTDKTPLESKHITVKVGSTANYTKSSYKFNYEALPTTAMYSDIRWTSSNDSIVVDKNGKCTPAKNEACSAIITCTVKDYMGNSTSDSVFLTFARIPATGVKVNPTQIEGGKIGETQQINATVSPEGTGASGAKVGAASSPTLYWSSSDESIATVDQNGIVTFVSGGNCVITCKTYDGGYTAECSVNVITNYSGLENLITQYTDLQLNEDNYYPDSWEEYNAVMDKAKNMVAVGGHSQAEVDRMSKELTEAYNNLRKYNYLKKVELYLDGEETKDFYQYDLGLLTDGISYKNAVLDLNVRLYPNNASYESVVWESSTSDIAVSSDGKCSPTVGGLIATGKGSYGLITCTVTDHFGNSFSDSVWVSFAYFPVTGMEISETSIYGAQNTTRRLTCKVLPDGSSIFHFTKADIQDYYWESDDESIATVDQDGLVTFLSAGSTIVRVISYDGGHFAECVVSSEGDRTALRKALEDYRDVDYTDYVYDYGMSFKKAYEEAERVMNDNTVSQNDIDQAAENLERAYTFLITHPLVKVESIKIDYTTYKRATLVSNGKAVTSGTISSSDALSVNLSEGYTNFNDYNYVTLSASSLPNTAVYKSISWIVDSSSQMNSEINNTSITLTPKKAGDGAWANITVKIVDHYDRVYSRSISVVMSDNVMTGFDITNTAETIYANAQPKQLAYTTSGNAEFSTIYWSSSNEAAVKVDSNGIITPVEKGEATITGKTLDGGYTDKIKITVITNFDALADRHSKYYNLIESVKDSYEYTEDSLNTLSAVVAEAQPMLNEGKATQAEVNEMVKRLDDAYNALVKYVAAEGLSIGFVEDSSVSLVNDGFIRYSNTVSLNRKSITLEPVLEPAGSFYTTIIWESSNPNITIGENGVLVNNSALPGTTKVTCTIENIYGGSYTASVYVSFVRSGVTDISFEEERVFGAPSQTVTLNPTVKGTNNMNASVKDCLYTSSNENIATVDENGVVTFITQGEAIITLTTLDGGYQTTIKAYTTWDTTALKAAMEVAEVIDYTDYAYEVGMAFKAAYDNAVVVYNNVYASQAEINAVCTALTEATTALEGNEFILPEVTVAQNGNALVSGGIIETDENMTAVLDVVLNDGAMVKSVEVTASDMDGVTAQINGTQVVITRSAEIGNITLTVKTVDDYDRETVSTYSFSVINQVIPVTSIQLTADGELVTGSLSYSCGGSYTNFKPITLGFIPTPGNANAIQSVTYSSDNKRIISVTDDGVVDLTALGKIPSSSKATITCTVTNVDGTTATASVEITITKS